MEDASTYQQMQDEMSRFEAEISTSDGLTAARPVIASATFGVVQQQLERGTISALPTPPAPPAALMGTLSSFPHMMQPMQPRAIYQPMPPPPPPSMMIPSQVQRMHPMSNDYDEYEEQQDEYEEYPMSTSSVPSFVRAGLPGPQLLPPKPQPVVLSAAPQIYIQPKVDKKEEKKKDKVKEKKRSPPPPPPRPKQPSPPPAPTIATTTYETQPKVKKERKSRKVVRTAGGQIWEDVTLLDWPDDDFRMFCGDLGNDVTDELLIRTFSKYSSFQKAKVVRDKRTNKSKGFGFVSFKDPGDFIKAMKEMDGRYVGSRPIKLRKSSWKNRSLDVVRKKDKEKQALLSLLMAGKS